jgi:hypothetical protein
MPAPALVRVVWVAGADSRAALSDRHVVGVIRAELPAFEGHACEMGVITAILALITPISCAGSAVGVNHCPGRGTAPPAGHREQQPEIRRILRAQSVRGAVTAGKLASGG